MIADAVLKNKTLVIIYDRRLLLGHGKLQNSVVSFQRPPAEAPAQAGKLESRSFPHLLDSCLGGNDRG